MTDMTAIDEFLTSEDALFHYTKLTVALEKILYKKQFKLSLLKDTNDPREYKRVLFDMSGWGLTPDAVDLWNATSPEIDRILKNECRVMCFCSNAKPTLITYDGEVIEDKLAHTEGWNKSRMWAQYGDSHYGICLVFSRSALENEIKSRKDNINEYRAGLVRYSMRERILWKSYTLNGNRLASEGIITYSMNHIIENAEDIFFTKHIDYRDEAEYRVVVFDHDRKMEYFNISSSIRGLIAGDRTPQVYFSLINDMCTNLEIECRRVYWDKGKPHLLLCNRA